MPNLSRFLEAQSAIYPKVLAELRAGHKRTHWMWFIFPQIQGLGSSSTARLYAIADLAEAQAYLAHPALGARLLECAAAVNAHPNSSVSNIFGYPDDLKFHSSITLFAQAADPASANVFTEALSLFFNGRPDSATLGRLHPAKEQYGSA